MRLRPSAVLVAVVLLLVGAAAGPARASAPTATLTAVGAADGGRTLHLDLGGSSDGVNVLPQLGCPADPATGAAVPCVRLDDQKSRPSGMPEGCAPTGATFASWRCDTRGFRALVVDASAAGESAVVSFNTRAAGGSGVCAGIPVTVRLGAGRGVLKAGDGCAETVLCADAYAGRVVVDQLDDVTGCRSVSRSVVVAAGGAAPAPAPAPGAGSGAGGASTPPGGSAAAGGAVTGGSVGAGSAAGGGAAGGGAAGRAPAAGGGASGGGASGGRGSGGGTPRRHPAALDLSSCRGARSGTGGDSPLYSVYIKARGRRGMTIYVAMRRAVPIRVLVRVRSRTGSGVVREVRRCAHRGTNLVTVPDATGGARSRRNYGVVVRSPNSTYPLRSSWESLPRR